MVSRSRSQEWPLDLAYRPLLKGKNSAGVARGLFHEAILETVRKVSVVRVQSMDWHFFRSDCALRVLTGRVEVGLSNLRLTTPDCFHRRDTGLSFFRPISSQSFAFVWLKVAPSVSSPKTISESAAKEEESSIGKPPLLP
ncbi:hypothetical protein M9H77_00317 [Catharanthus roseus]|nr:hypothetical protein M9H77_00317 [Catharanthus roseus]